MVWKDFFKLNKEKTILLIFFILFFPFPFNFFLAGGLTPIFFVIYDTAMIIPEMKESISVVRDISTKYPELDNLTGIDNLGLDNLMNEDGVYSSIYYLIGWLVLQLIFFLLLSYLIVCFLDKYIKNKYVLWTIVLVLVLLALFTNIYSVENGGVHRHNWIRYLKGL